MASQAAQYEVIEGQISYLQVKPENVHFLKRIKQDQELASVVAIGQAITGQAGAVSSAQAAVDEGDPVESFVMSIGGLLAKGSFWKATFKNGDSVKIVGRKLGENFHVTAVVDTASRIIWMQPHCERGIKAKSKHLFKCCGWFVLFCYFAALLLTALTNMPFWLNIVIMTVAAPVILLVTVGMSWGDFMSFSREMNAVASALNWPSPTETDLLKTTRQARKTGKPELPMGVYYF
ncbi:MAG TPA: putative type VI secretion system effector [Rhodocyclaceae bacterium]|nr:putative type VI secretion system effector [Rhodocyclaceae bacterium]